jgi:DNA-binding winged helix-turn-helix (wHTH) protein/TolB-like protein/Tfp pilus assembly protein PilF
MNSEEKHFYQFKSFRLDVAERQLLHNGETLPLTPKAFDVLAALVERGGHLVEKDELLKSVWADSFVEEANVPRIVHTLRKVLGEDENGNKFIETVAKKGYRFVAEVDEVREPIARNHENGNRNFAIAIETFPETIAAENFPETIAAEKLPEAEFQIPPPVTVETVVQLAKEQKHTTRIVLFTVGFLSAIFLIFLLSFNRQSADSIAPNDIKSIAILPLKPLMTENRDSIYELGVADSLILKLSPVKGLIVRPLSATRQYADVAQDAIAAGRQQQVDYVLASNYQIADGRIRITSQLINVQSGLVEEVFKDEQNNSNGFAVQDAVAANIGQKLLKKLNREPNNLAAKRYMPNEEAYRLYLDGMNLTDKQNIKEARKAAELFEQSVKLDPNYALGYAGLAYAHWTIAMYGGNENEEFPKAMNAVQRALALDENLAEAHSNLGQIQHTYEWKHLEAEKSHRRAIELEPNSSFAHRNYAFHLLDMGRFDEAVAEIKTAIDLDPNSVWNQRSLGNILYLARRYDEAIVQLKRVVEMDASRIQTYYGLSRSFEQKGDYAQAFEWFLRGETQGGKSAEELNSWKIVYNESGWQGVLRRQLEMSKEKEKKGEVQSAAVVRRSAQLGDTEQAFVYLEKSYQKRELLMIQLLIDPQLDSLRSDARFDVLVKRVRLK